MKKFPVFFLCLVLCLAVISPAWGNAEYANASDMANDTLRLSEIISILELTHISHPERPQLIDNGIEGVIKSLDDPYTSYLTPENFEELKSPHMQYVGIGITLEKVITGLVITEVFEGSPAYKKGIAIGDRIIKINNQNVKDLSLEKVVEKIKGVEGSPVSLEIRTAQGKNSHVELLREKVSFPNLKKQLLEQNIGYIKLLAFSEDAGKQFTAAFEDLNNQGIQGLILDLRGNSGGFLTSAEVLLSNFIDYGPIMKIKGNNDELFLEEVTGKNWGKPIIILMNEYSASASEVVAGALQDYQLAKVLGSKSFGKGSMQQTFPLQSGGFLKVTTNKWLTPNERSIDGIGISPDYPVLEPTLQLFRAIEILKGNAAPSISYLPSTQQWLLNEKDIHFFVGSQKINNTNLYPLRFISEAFSYTSEWNGADKSITLSLDKQSIKIPKNKYTLLGGIAYLSDKELAENLNLKINHTANRVTFNINQ